MPSFLFHHRRQQQMRRNIKLWCQLSLRLSFAILVWSGLLSNITPAQQTTTPNLKIAFIGDQSLGPDAVAVLNLIKTEGAQAVLHSGDLDYVDNPAAWEAQINNVLGADYPYFVTVGNHDELAWRGPGGYQQYVINRFTRLGISWTGDLGVQSTFHFKGLMFVLTAPGIQSGFDSGNSDAFIRDQLAADNSLWTICSWHKNMKLMQVGGKQDETGWPVYEEARKGGAIVATAHEHSYSRTYLLSSMINQTVASNSNTLTMTKGNTFAFVSGLGGHSIRPQLLSGSWWARVAASTCFQNDPVCQPADRPGALFGVFNVDGQANKAFFYFKDTAGRVLDSFTVISEVELPRINSLAPAMADIGGPGFMLTIDGENFTGNSVVRWNNIEKPTSYVSSTRITATISQADLATAGPAAVTVVGPGGTSSPATFIVGPSSITLFTEPNSSRAIALDSVTMLRDPFLLTAPNNFSADNRTRLMIFSPNLSLLPGDSASAVTVRAEDAQQRVFPLIVEFIGALPQFSSLTQIVVRVPADLQTADSFWISLSYRNSTSNKALITLREE